MRLARRRRLAVAEVVVRAVAQSRIGVVGIQAKAAPGRTRHHRQVAGEHPRRVQLVGTVRLDLVPPAVGQLAIGVVHDLRVIPVGRGRHVGLADIGLHLTLAVAVAARPQVVDLALPLAVERMLQVQVQAVVLALHRGVEVEVVLPVHLHGVVAAGQLRNVEVRGAARVDQDAARNLRGVVAVRVDAHRVHLGDDRHIVGDVVDGVAQVAIGRLGAVHPRVVQFLVETEDVFILVLRLQVGRGRRARVTALAVLAVVRQRLPGADAGVDRGQAGGHAIRVDAGVGVVGAGVQRGTGRTLRHAARQGEVIAAGIAVDLHAGVAVDVPAEAHARRPLRRGQAQIGLAVATVVGELVVAQADLDQPAVVDLPAVLDVLRPLRDAERAVVVIAVLVDVVAVAARTGRSHPRRVAPVGAGRGRSRAAQDVLVRQRVAVAIGHLVVVPRITGTVGREVRTRVDIGRVLVVDAGGQRVITELVADVDAQVGVGRAMPRQVDRRHRLVVGDDVAAGDGRVLVFRVEKVRVGRIESGRVAVIRALHLAVQRAHREVVGDVAGELRRVQIGTVLGRGGATDVVGLLATVVVVVVGRALVGVLAGGAGQLQHVAVVDVPVQLAVPLRPVLAGVRDERCRHRTHAAVDRAVGVAEALFALGFDGGEEEQLVLDQRAADVGIDCGRPRLVVAATAIDIAARTVTVDVIEVLGIALQVGRCPLHLATEMPLVGTALADLADHAAVGATVGRAIAATEDFLLIDGAVGQGQAAEAAQRIGRVETVDVVRVLDDRGAAQRNHRAAGGAQAVEQAAAFDHARSQQRDRLGAARQRQAGQLLRRDDGTGVDTGHVDAGQGIGLHGDRAQRLRARRTGEGNLGAGTHAHGDMRARVDGLPIALQGHGVVAQRQRVHRVATVRIHRDLAGDTRVVADQHGFAAAGRRLAENAARGGLRVDRRRRDGAVQAQGDRGGEAQCVPRQATRARLVFDVALAVFHVTPRLSDGGSRIRRNGSAST